MGKIRCAKCDAEIDEKEVFVHEDERYCPECALDHVRAKHAAFYRTPT